MALADPIKHPRDDVTEAARRIRTQARRTLVGLARSGQDIARLVEVHGRGALAAELGADAPAMQDFYRDLRQVVATHLPGAGTDPRFRVPAMGDLKA